MQKTWMSLTTLVITILVASLSAAQDVPAATPDRVEVFKFSAGKTIELDYYLPSGFEAHKSYPVMLAPGSFFLQDDPAAFGWVVVRAGIGDRRFTTKDAETVLDHLSKMVRPRSGQFYIMGYSANSEGIFRIAAALPTHFAGILTIPGHPRQSGEYETLAGMKIRFIVGERDGYWLREATKAHTQFMELGTDTDIEIIENGGHVLKQLAGEPLFRRIDDWFR